MSRPRDYAAASAAALRGECREVVARRQVSRHFRAFRDRKRAANDRHAAKRREHVVERIVADKVEQRPRLQRQRPVDLHPARAVQERDALSRLTGVDGHLRARTGRQIAVAPHERLSALPPAADGQDRVCAKRQVSDRLDGRRHVRRAVPFRRIASESRTRVIVVDGN